MEQSRKEMWSSGIRRKDREISDINEIEKILLQCKICHIAMIDDRAPYVVPLNYGYKIFDGNLLELYFHSALEGKKLNILRKNNKICFNVAYEGALKHADTPCKFGLFFASIIGYGETVFIEDTNKKCEALSILFKHQTGEDVAFTAEQSESVCVFKIISSDFTGKRNF